MEAEQASLGAMLLERDAIARALEILRVEDFYRESHRMIYQGILDLFNRSEPVDLITLGEWLKSRNLLESVGGTLYLTTMMSQVPTAAGIGHYAKIVRDRALQRQLIKTADEIMAAAYNTDRDLDEIVDESEQKIFTIAERGVISGFISLQELVKQQFITIEDNMAAQNPATGLSTGYTELDGITAGLHAGELIILAARPSMGKTAFALNVAPHYFVLAQSFATVTALSWNFALNNHLTYRDQRLAGWRWATGLVRFQIVCVVGAVSNVGAASWLYGNDRKWWVAGLGGAAMGAVWNYVISASFVWRNR